MILKKNPRFNPHFKLKYLKLFITAVMYINIYTPVQIELSWTGWILSTRWIWFFLIEWRRCLGRGSRFYFRQTDLFCLLDYFFLFTHCSLIYIVFTPTLIFFVLVFSSSPSTSQQHRREIPARRDDGPYMQRKIRNPPLFCPHCCVWGREIQWDSHLSHLSQFNILASYLRLVCSTHNFLFLQIKINNSRLLTSDPPLKEAVLGVFDLTEIVAGGSKNKRIDVFCAKFFAKSIG